MQRLPEGGLFFWAISLSACYPALMNRFGPDELLNCYARGVFPMADSRDDPSLFLLDPEARGVLPLDGLHISKSLKKTLRKAPFDIRINSDFIGTVLKCAEPTPGRENTWINDVILNLYAQLHDMGHAHSVECWKGDDLVGGLYGVTLGGAFFGESMFSRETDASKVALVRLVERLNDRGFKLLDAQFITDHLRTLGAIEISRADYHKRLEAALSVDAKFA